MYANNNDDVVSQRAIRSLIVKEGITYAQAEYYLKTGLHIDAQEASSSELEQ